MRDAGHRTPDAGHRTSDGEKSKNNISTPQGGGHNSVTSFELDCKEWAVEQVRWLVNCNIQKKSWIQKVNLNYTVQTEP